MDYLPEQQRLVERLRTYGTLAEAGALVADARVSFATFRDAFAAVPPVFRLVEPNPGKWSPQEIIDHVVECHRTAPRQLRRILAGENGDEAIRAYVQSAAPHAKHWRALLKEFSTIHDEVISAAAELANLPMPKATAPIEAVVRLKDDGRTREHEWLEHLDWKAYLFALRSHALQHVKQLERTLTEISVES